MSVYNIAICDDDKNTCSELEGMLTDIFQEFHVYAEIEPWYSGENLCKHLEMGNEYDLLFLDIELLTLNGVAVGKFIREKLNDIKTKIIFISYNKEYAMQLFSVQPLDFIVKPFEYNTIKKAVDTFLKIENTGKVFLEYRNGNMICREWCENIIYITSDNRKVQIVTFQAVKEFYGKLKGILIQLPPNFLQIHQSYIINQDYVTEYTYERVKMFNGDELNISRRFQNQVRNQLIDNRRSRE